MKRLELPTSCSQSRRATNCATPRLSDFVNFLFGTCFGRPLAVPKICLPLGLRANFDRCAIKHFASSSTGRARVLCPKRRATNCATPRIAFSQRVILYLIVGGLSRDFVFYLCICPGSVISLVLFIGAFTSSSRAAEWTALLPKRWRNTSTALSSFSIFSIFFTSLNIST